MTTIIKDKRTRLTPAEIEAPLTVRMQYTTLWRFMNNLQHNLKIVCQDFSSGSKIDTRELMDRFHMENDLKNQWEMKGPPHAHHLLINEPARDHYVRQYNLVNMVSKSDKGEVIEDSFLKWKRDRQEKDETLAEGAGTFVHPLLFNKLRKKPVIKINE